MTTLLSPTWATTYAELIALLQAKLTPEMLAKPICLDLEGGLFNAAKIQVHLVPSGYVVFNVLENDELDISEYIRLE